MEGKKQVDMASASSSSSSFPFELFGIKEPAETDFFSSIFAPPKVAGSWDKQYKQDNLEKNVRPVAHHSATYKDKSSAFQEEKLQPCYLSSSLYYGGQEIYPLSSTTQGYGSYAAIPKKSGESEEDTSGNNSYGASRGNWWQGSLYY